MKKTLINIGIILFFAVVVIVGYYISAYREFYRNADALEEYGC